MVQRKKWDVLFSEIVRSIGYCEARGFDDISCSPQLQCAHIVTRGRSATRTDFRNAFSLCHAHHRYFHDYFQRFSRFVSETWAGDYYEQVERKSKTPTKVNWKERTEELKNILKQIKSGEITLEEARELGL